LSVDVQERTVTNLDTNEVLEIRNLTGISLGILEAGGILPFTQQRLQAKALASE
jgi:hypothetical protein